MHYTYFLRLTKNREKKPATSDYWMARKRKDGVSYTPLIQLHAFAIKLDDHFGLKKGVARGLSFCLKI